MLTVIAQQEGLSQTDIVEVTGIDRSTLAEMVRRLKGRGLLERRRRKDDERAYAIKLTQEGQRTLKKAEPLAKRVDEKILRSLGSRGSAFLDDLAAMISQLESRRA